MAEARPAGRRTFGPVVLLGLASAGLAAVAGNRPWVEWTGTSEGQGSLLTVTGDDTATVPLAGALALAVLACWGVVLVTRGRVRRAIAALALVVSGGMVATAVLGYRSATNGLRSDLAELGIDDLSVQPVVWYWVFLTCALVAVVAAGAAVRLAPAWPEMGSRYDAPGAAPQPHEETGLETGLDLWKALDEGRDPTLTDRRPPTTP
jgi:uncharacterized membrane protein (TIGR02234 family)